MTPFLRFFQFQISLVMFFECYINGSQVIVDTQKQVITNPLIPNDNRLVSLFVMDIQLLSMVWKTIMENFGKRRKEGRTLSMFLSHVIATTLHIFDMKHDSQIPPALRDGKQKSPL